MTRSQSLQDLVNSMNEVARDERSRYHLTLGGLIEALEKAPPEAELWVDEDGSDDTDTFPGSLSSYRGYYSDLAFEPTTERRTVAQVLADAKAALGASFEGYKGGSFTMKEDTPLWVSTWGGVSSLAVVGCEFDGCDDYRLLCRQLRD